MLNAERKHFILDCLAREGRVLSQALCDALKVSEDTIRRDLRELAAAGCLKRVHGGALPVSRSGTLPVAERKQVRTEEKQALAAHAATQLRSGQVLILDGGSTNILLAQNLPHSLSLTVITHCPAIAEALGAHTAIEVLLVGGRLLRRAGVTVGASVVDAFRNLRADVCLLGVCGIDAAFGLGSEDYEEAAVKRAMLAASTDSYVLATADKFGETPPFAIAPVSQVGHILTTSAVAPEYLDACRAAGAALEILTF